MKQNKINYYNTDDEIQFQKLDDFRKFNKNIKVNKSEKNQDVKYSNTDKNNFNGILKTNEDFDLLNEPNIKKELNYYNNSDFDKFETLDNFQEYNFKLNNNNENQNSNSHYSKDDYSQFNKIIKTENQEKNQVEAKNKKVKVIDYNKLNESNKKIKNKVGIEKIKIVYFD